jgi:hypothetical protein
MSQRHLNLDAAKKRQLLQIKTMLSEIDQKASLVEHLIAQHIKTHAAKRAVLKAHQDLEVAQLEAAMASGIKTEQALHTLQCQIEHAELQAAQIERRVFAGTADRETYMLNNEQAARLSELSKSRRERRIALNTAHTAQAQAMNDKEWVVRVEFEAHLEKLKGEKRETEIFFAKQLA